MGIPGKSSSSPDGKGNNKRLPVLAGARVLVVSLFTDRDAWRFPLEEAFRGRIMVSQRIRVEIHSSEFNIIG
jgi:hypothetical protein